MSNITLYTFGGSVWAAVPELAILELGYPEGAVEKKVVNLINGENFIPWFLKINPTATLPTLEANGNVYSNTTDVTSYLIKNAPTTVKGGNSALIKEIHEDKYDPNFALLLARNDEELTAKAGSIPGLYLSNRQESLNKNSVTPEAAPFKAFYDAKIVDNGGALAIYQGKAPEAVKLGFFARSKSHFENVASYIFEILPAHLPESGFIGGDNPGEDDFHVGAWLTRIAATVGATKGEEGLKALENALGKPLPANVAAYWNAWSVRPSWKEVYADGLH